MVILISEPREIFARGTRNPGHWKISETIQISLMTVIRNPSFADNETGILGLGSSIQDCLGFIYMGRDRRISPRETFQHPCLRWKKIHLVLIFALIFSTVTCSFQPKTQTMIIVPTAAPKDTPEDGGLTSVVWQILMDCIIMVLIAADMPMEQNGPRLGDNFIHWNALRWN